MAKRVWHCGGCGAALRSYNRRCRVCTGRKQQDAYLGRAIAAQPPAVLAERAQRINQIAERVALELVRRGGTWRKGVL